jgi:hypothetical protein
MNFIKLKHFLLAITCLFTFSCVSKTLIRDAEYEPVYRTLSKQDAADEALIVFPQKEKDGFITTFEKTWIKFWVQKEKLSADEIKDVQNLSDQIEQRKFVSISHEASVFLVGESEDGYIPSEHEIISLHLFLAMLYLDTANVDSAHVELKRAIEYLANNPDGKETTFDDAAIRVWLASLWEALGDRNASDVDLRKAMELSGNKAMQSLIDIQQRKTHLIMMGSGPKTKWNSDGQNFVFEYQLGEKDVSEKNYIFTTKNWYSWHQSRNTKIRDRLLSSHYMINSLGQQTSRLSQKGAGLAISGLMYTAALGVFVGGIYVAFQTGDPKAAETIIELAGLLALGIGAQAKNLNDKVTFHVEESKQEEAESLKMYRMIRFLPSEIQYVDENLNKSLKGKVYKGFRKLLGVGNNQVEFIWNPE